MPFSSSAGQQFSIAPNTLKSLTFAGILFQFLVILCLRNSLKFVVFGRVVIENLLNIFIFKVLFSRS
jgi:hypothetical protein